MNFCYQCGTKNEELDMYCGNCGTKLDPGQTQSNYTQPIDKQQSQLTKSYPPPTVNNELAYQTYQPSSSVAKGPKPIDKALPLFISLILPGLGMVLIGDRHVHKYRYTGKAVIIFIFAWIGLQGVPVVLLIAWIVGLIMTNQAVNEYNSLFISEYGNIQMK